MQIPLIYLSSWVSALRSHLVLKPQGCWTPEQVCLVRALQAPSPSLEKRGLSRGWMPWWGWLQAKESQEMLSVREEQAKTGCYHWADGHLSIFVNGPPPSTPSPFFRRADTPCCFEKIHPALKTPTFGGICFLHLLLWMPHTGNTQYSCLHGQSTVQKINI